MVDRSVAHAMVAWAGIDGSDVLEIGPGRGALTDLLVARARRLYLVEIDPQLFGELEARYADCDNVTLVHGDVLDIDLSSLLDRPVHVVSSLPYESGTAIVQRLLDEAALAEEIVVMLQREVCERMTAVGGKQFGPLSVHVQLSADTELGRVVGPAAFHPRPKVESRLLRLRTLACPRYEVGDRRHFDAVVRVAFAGRRKMLRNTLGEWLEGRLGKAAAEAVFAAAGVEASARPETIGLEGFARISREAYQFHYNRARTT